MSSNEALSKKDVLKAGHSDARKEQHTVEKLQSSSSLTKTLGASNLIPNCKTCKYYYITWQESHPYGCKIFQMKTRHLPAYHVKRESGIFCLYYENKKSTASNLKLSEAEVQRNFLTANENPLINKLG